MPHRKTHEHAGHPPLSVAVHIVVVSSTRTPETDRSGPAIAAALEAGGHRVVRREIVPDDPGRIAEVLAEVVGGPHRAVIFAGGTGISLRDGTFEAVDGALDKRLPGFGELFRMLSYQEIGPAAMLSRATAGVVGDTVVFAIPGSAGAGRLATERLIAPELGHLLRELDKEAPIAPSGQRVAAAVPTLEPAPESPEPDRPEAAWLRQLTLLGGVLERGRVPAMNPGVAAVPAAVGVLSSAGERAAVRVGERDYLAFGFPDLLRPSSRVLLVGCEGSPFGEILALHRWPRGAGVLRDEPGGVLGPSGRLGRLAVERTGRDYPESGRVLAVDGGCIYVVESGMRVFCWDGRRRREEGLLRGVLASLLLRWSQR